MLSQRVDSFTVPLLESNSVSYRYFKAWTAFLFYFVVLLILFTYDFEKHQITEILLGATPKAEVGDVWKIEIPTGQLTTDSLLAPLNYAQISNPWSTFPFEASYAAAPLRGAINKFAYAMINGPVMRGVNKDSYMVRIQHNGEMVHGLDGNFVLKVNKSWRKLKDSKILAPSFDDGINWMIVHYTCQVALSYFSFIYSNDKSFTARGGPDTKFGYNGGKFAYLHPLLVKITDKTSKMWTLGLLEYNLPRVRRTGSERSRPRAKDFATWLEKYTAKYTYNAENSLNQLFVTHQQGFYYDTAVSSLFMTDGTLTTEEFLGRDHPMDEKILPLLQSWIDDSLKEISKFLRKRQRLASGDGSSSTHENTHPSSVSASTAMSLSAISEDSESSPLRSGSQRSFASSTVESLKGVSKFLRKKPKSGSSAGSSAMHEMMPLSSESEHQDMSPLDMPDLPPPESESLPTSISEESEPPLLQSVSQPLSPGVDQPLSPTTSDDSVDGKVYIPPTWSISRDPPVELNDEESTNPRVKNCLNCVIF